MTKINNTCSNIFNYLIKAKVARLIDISDGLKKDRQLIDYHIKNLVSCGLIIIKEKDGIIYYMPQPCFIDDSVIESVCGELIPLIHSISKMVDLSNVDNKKRALRELVLFFIDTVLDK